MGAQIAGHILREEFYIYAKGQLDNLARSSIVFYQILAEIEDSLGATNEIDTPFGYLEGANNNHRLFNQSIYRVTHDQLLEAMDGIFEGYAYLLKINSFIPHLITRFDGSYTFQETIYEGFNKPTVQEISAKTLTMDFKEGQKQRPTRVV